VREFHAEQRALADACWQLLCVREELPEPGTWLRRPVFGTDVFVQRSGDELRAYENACAHRGFPIRTGDSGAGPIRCSFHGWTYNKDGVPTGIPRNAELFQISRDAQKTIGLRQVRLAELGRFVFATTSDKAPPLEAFLGRHAQVYRVLDARLAPLYAIRVLQSRASWRLHAEIALDDYHLASIHPHSFGAEVAVDAYRYHYERDGLHSCLLRRRDPDWSFAPFWAELAGGGFERTGYKMFNSFPGTTAGVTPNAAVVTSYLATGPRTTTAVVWSFLWPDARDGLGTDVLGLNAQLFREDREACEAWQTTVDALAHPPVLGVLEQRVRWFRETYAAVVGA